MTSSADISTVMNRILDTAADNLRIAKILLQMPEDPHHIGDAVGQCHACRNGPRPMPLDQGFYPGRDDVVTAEL